tara:strand:+ start:118 stop:1944 length:1827 start_codon:yes stop_codon:yes gene_type:complete
MIDLPEIFKNDTQGNTTHLVPLVIINNRLYLSTQKLKLQDNVYAPLLKKMGNISEGVDIVDRKYKVSNSSMTFYNYTYNNVKLIDKLLEEETFNTSLEVYFKSQNAKTLNDCLKVYSGYIKNIQENKDDISISCEDKTEQVLGKEIPQRFTPTEGLPEKQRNIPYPIVYGEVEQAPLLFDVLEDDSSVFKLVSDDKPIANIARPQIFDNDTYVRIVDDADLLQEQVEGTILKRLTKKQYDKDDSENFFTVQKHIELGDEYEEDTILSSDGHVGSPIAFNMVEVEGESTLEHTASEYKQYWRFTDSDDQRAFTNILSFSNPEGTEASKDVEQGIYLMPKIFSDENNEMGLTKWIFGQSRLINSDLYENLFGESQFNFQAKPFVSDSSVVKNILKDDLEENKDLYHQVIYQAGNMICKAFTINSSQLGGQQFDDLFLELNDNTVKIFDIGYSAANAGQTEANVTYEIERVQVQGTPVLPIQTKDISNNNITIGLRELSNSNFILTGGIDQHGGIWEWLYIENMRLKRRCIMSDFTSRNLYAYVLGRVDNEDLRYTSTLTTLTTEARAVRPTRDMAVAPTAPRKIVRPTKPKVKVQKPVKTKTKKTIKGGY